jgi:hypothetical protein
MADTENTYDGNGNLVSSTSKGTGYKATPTTYDDPRLTKVKAEDLGPGAPKRSDYPAGLGGDAKYYADVRKFKAQKTGGAASQASALASPAPSPAPR